MRDDVAALVSGLTSLYRAKLALLNKLIENGNRRRAYFAEDELFAFARTFDDDIDLMAQANVIDYEISVLRTRICEQSGIQESSFEKTFFSGDDYRDKLCAAHSQCMAAARTAEAELDELIPLLNDAEAALAVEIEQISSIRRVKKYLEAK